LRADPAAPVGAPAAASGSVRRTHRPLVLTGMVLAMILAAIEGTIVATAMPSIAAKLGGFALYSWVFSSYLLMQAVMTPIFGKLSDLYGRKPVLMGGVVVFLVGSVLCGLAQSMAMLIAFRFVQGAGAGAVLPMTATLAGDLYSLEERGRVQGYLASVWGISSIIGPLAGGLIVQNADWHWIFWLNVPFGILALVLIGLFLHEHVEHRVRRIDFQGAALLLVGLSSLMLALTQGGEWGGRVAGGLIGLAVVALTLFVRRQRTAPDPMMHLELWDIRVIRLGNLAILMAGVAMIGLITFLPTYVQGVLGRSALVAGFALSAMSIGWPLASVAAGRLFVRLGVRRIVRAGGTAVTVGAMWIALFASYGPVAVGAGSFVMGMGFGLLNTTFIVAIQTSVAWAQRGVATASNMLMRNLGNALGAAVFGGVLNLSMTRWLGRRGLSDRVSLESIRGLMADGSGAAGALDPATAALLRDGLAGSLQLVFWGIVLCAAAILLLSWRVPDLERYEV
jgi:EmrB/QacA subfamily drug resistance transporter